jgi:TolB-like protein
VTVRLLKVESGEQLWADSFDEKFTDIFVVQNSIARLRLCRSNKVLTQASVVSQK